jgi:hypothetical protein
MRWHLQRRFLVRVVQAASLAKRSAPSKSLSTRQRHDCADFKYEVGGYENISDANEHLKEDARKRSIKPMKTTNGTPAASSFLE